MGLSARLRVAVAQMDIFQGRVSDNLERVLKHLTSAAHQGVQLVVFPECALSGYCFGSREEALPFALTVPTGVDLENDRSPLGYFARACRELGVIGILGFLEVGEDGNLYNSALVAGEAFETPYVYRKTHLPTLGVDRFVTPGSVLEVVDVGGLRLGVLICYDARFPEAARVLTLRGADLIALPTNWPDGAESAPEYLIRARSRENGVYIAAANRIGVERGRHFIGRSQIVAPSGDILATAGEEETLLWADITPEAARSKRIVIEPGEWEQDTVGDRRPGLYGALVQ